MKFPSHVDVSRETRQELIELLNSCLATAIDLHWQVKQAHWNVRGKQFISWHELFDEIADDVRKHADKFAERAGALGGYAEGTIRLAARRSELEEYDLNAIGGEEHLSALVSRISTYASLFRKGIHRSDELDDPVTSDLFTEILGEMEQHLWLLESHLYGPPASRRESAAAPSTEELPAQPDA